ncbi:MAG: hypothetical protein RI897_1939 [Verrucomicrobiota bacterium]|jgi:RNA polymerase sigma-70 factor (ECF subfamily)
MEAEPTDQQLVQRAKLGELEAFELLTTRYERQIYGLARRIVGSTHDAEDVTQVTFISVLEHLDGFREEASFSTWLHRIATFAALKVLRKRRGLETVPFEVPVDDGSASGESLPRPDYIADWSTNPEELASRNEVRGLIEGALERLDEKHRLVFVLRDIEGFSVRETSETLGISEGNVKVRLLRARLQLREQLTRVFGDPERVLRRGHHEHSGAGVAVVESGEGAEARGL